MKAKVKNPAQIQFNNVYISELSHVVSIYKNATTKISSENSKLSSHFGLPLIIAVNDNQLIGFAPATLDLSDEIEMNCFFSEESAETEIGNQLKEKRHTGIFTGLTITVKQENNN